MRSFALLTLLIGGHTLLETARDALFLGKLPASRLALVYGLIALVALAVAGPNARFVRRFGEGRALLTSLLLAAAGTVALYLQALTPPVIFAIYVWTGFLGTVIVVQFWLFMAAVFTPSQGKRLFGPIAAGGVTGAIVGAVGAAGALTRLPVRTLLVGAAIAYVLCALVALTIDVPPPLGRRRAWGGGRAPQGPAEVAPPPSPPPAEPRRLIALLRQYPYIGWLAALTALSTATVLGTDYLFKAEAARTVAPADLGIYFARSYAAFNAAALVVTVIATGPLVRRVGVTRALLVMPLLLLAGTTAVVLTGAHAAVLLTKGVDGALRHSLHRVTSELLGLPVPLEVRPRVKPVLDGALARTVQAAMAAVILVLATTGHGAPRELGLVVGGLALAWLGAAFALRSHHLDMYRRALSKGTLDVERHLELDVRLVGVVVEAMASPDPARVLAAMNLLADNGRARSIPGSVLQHPSEEVRIRALELMARTGRAAWAAEAEPLLAPPSPERVRVAAVRALAGASALTALERGRGDESPVVRAHVAVALTRADHANDPRTAPLVQAILEIPGNEGRAARIALLDAIRDLGDRRFSEVIEAVIDEADPKLMEHAVLAMATIRDPRFLTVLIHHLHVRSGRAAVRDALVDLGEPAQAALEREMRGGGALPAVRLHIPRTLSRFRNQRAADFLVEQLAIDPSRLVRYKVLRGLGKLVAETGVTVDRDAIFLEMRRNLVEHLEALSRWVPLDAHPHTKQHPSGRLLLGLLDDKIRQSLERAFRLLHIAYRREDIRGVYLALRSGDRVGRSNAMEFIDALTSDARGDEARATRELLKLLIDDLPARQKVARAAAHVPDAPADRETTLLLLLRDHDSSVAALAASHGVELGLDRVTREATELAQDRPSLLELMSANVRPAPPPAEATSHGP